MLIVFSGLPGVGKTTVARALVRALNAMYVRIDSIEQALAQSGHRVGVDGYLIGYAVAEDNLRAGHLVVVDCVNPWAETRDAWRVSLNALALPRWTWRSFVLTLRNIDVASSRAWQISRAMCCQVGKTWWYAITARGTALGSR